MTKRCTCSLSGALGLGVQHKTRR
ncbi:hypothetical protein DESC_70029 [Desulfosarcina cetonica]|nr:hypothetical protein DESC_70029 [Desulfosarcina cetonica]